jgi:hypothetical protein
MVGVTVFVGVILGVILGVGVMVEVTVGVGVFVGVILGVGVIGYTPSLTNTTLLTYNGAIEYVSFINQIFLV